MEVKKTNTDSQKMNCLSANKKRKSNRNQKQYKKNYYKMKFNYARIKIIWRIFY